MTQFVRRRFVQIVIGAVVAVVVCGVLTVWMPYQREQRIAAIVKSLGGTVEWINLTPVEVTPIIGHTPIWSRILLVNFAGTHVIDSDLKHLEALPVCRSLDLSQTQVTDAGLERFHGMTNLRIIHLTNTRTTSEGRASLRKALPNCMIEPNP